MKKTHCKRRGAALGRSFRRRRENAAVAIIPATVLARGRCVL